jgi:hypothetical protein
LKCLDDTENRSELRMGGVAEDFVGGTKHSRGHGSGALHAAKCGGNLINSAG